MAEPASTHVRSQVEEWVRDKNTPSTRCLWKNPGCLSRLRQSLRNQARLAYKPRLRLSVVSDGQELGDLLPAPSCSLSLATATCNCTQHLLFLSLRPNLPGQDLHVGTAAFDSCACAD